MLVRFVVKWWDEQGFPCQEVFDGRGAYNKALSLRDRLGDPSAAFVTREELRKGVWQQVAAVNDVHPSKLRRKKTT